MRETARKADQRSQQQFCLKQICFQAVRKHLAALGVKAVLGKCGIFSYLRFTQSRRTPVAVVRPNMT